MPDTEALDLVFHILRIIAAASVIGAFILAYKLYRETDRAWYWLSLLLSAFFFALSQWIIVFVPVIQSFALLAILRDLSEVGAIILFAISCYGIYNGMMEIRKMVG
jgi:hypothetical protein